MENRELPLFCEPIPCYDSGEFKKEQGEIVYAYGVEALRIWVEKVMRREAKRYAYEGYSTRYGHELDTLIGRPMNDGTAHLVRGCISDALCANPYITAVSCVESKCVGGVLHMGFDIQSVYDKIYVEGDFVL